MAMNTLQGKTALITGGSKGIGYGIAESLLREGMNVAITSRTQEAADAAVARLAQAGAGKVIGITADVRDFRGTAKSRSYHPEHIRRSRCTRCQRRARPLRSRHIHDTRAMA